MSEQEQEIKNNVEIEQKDISDEIEINKLIEDEELEEALEEAEEIEELEEKQERKRMSEEEFFDSIDEYEGKNHGLTLLLDRFIKLLSSYAKKYNAEVDLELWNEVAKPSLNVGFWYYQEVEGMNVMLNYPKLSLIIGLVSTAFIGLGALAQIKKAKKQKITIQKREQKQESKAEKEEQEESKGKVEANSDLLTKVSKNLSS